MTSFPLDGSPSHGPGSVDPDAIVIEEDDGDDGGIEP